MDDQVLPDLQFVSQPVSPSSPRVGPGSVRTSSSSYSSSYIYYYKYRVYLVQKR
jgi:hypothetical protein